ncbi:MAG: hypothetical protein PWQ25_482 [Deferribacteres bacterium]|jgi:ABC-type maltose transport system permease subunit|nr:hypothetical protein [Deferribacteres bacterium]
MADIKLFNRKKAKKKTNRFVNVIIILTLFIFFNVSFAQDNKTDDGYYCNDKETLQEYEDLIKKYPDDMNVQTLHALWLGLCIKTGRGDITINQGNEIFDKYRKQIIDKLHKQKMKDESSKSL